MVGGLVLGPIRAAKGVSQLPDHPVRGVNNIIGGAGQTAAFPMAVFNPATMAYAAPALVAQHAMQSGLNAIGVDPDYSELGGNIAGIATGGAVHKGLNATGTINAPDSASLGPLLAREVTGRVPLLGRIAAFKKPSISEYMNLITKPKDTGDTEGIQPSEPAPAPYRMSGKQIQDAITVTPRAPFVPKGLLKAAPDITGAPAPEVLPPIAKPAASSPKTAQTAILKNIGVASPAATLKPMTRIPTAEITPRPDLSFAGSRSGESAAMNQLSENFSPQRLGINDLRGVAQARGIKVDPADTHQVLINKIHDSLTPDELDKFEQAAQERMQPDYSLPSQ
jgi:hypothetical protein